MKTQLYQTLVALFIMSVLVSGCNTKGGKATDNNMGFDSIRVDMTRHLFDNPDNPNCNLQIHFTYPVKYSNKEILEKVQHLFTVAFFGDDYEKLSPKDAASKYTEDYLEGYKSLEDEYKEEVEKADGSPVEAWFSYYEMSSNNITYNQNDILSYSVYVETYTGGAHGSHATTNHVINLKTGEPITESDIFVSGFQSSLAQIIVDKIARKNNVKDASELENIGFFSVDEITPNGNFLVDGEGITYTFNEYEIAAYVVGTTSVLLPYEELQHLIKEDSPIIHLAF